MSPFRRRWSTGSCRRRRRPTSTRSSRTSAIATCAVVVGEPFRQWVIENRFAGRVPRWDLSARPSSTTSRRSSYLKMRVLNAAQSALAYLGLLAGHEHTFDDMTDAVLAALRPPHAGRGELPTLPPVPGISPDRYVEQCFGRLRNTAIRHRNHQIATDGSQKIVQRLLNPILERLRRGESVELLAVAVAAWMAYLVSGVGRGSAALVGGGSACRPGRRDRRPDRRRRAGARRRHPRHRRDLRPGARARRTEFRATVAAISTDSCRTSRWPMSGSCSATVAVREEDNHEARLADRAVSGDAARSRSPTGPPRSASRRSRSPAGRSPPGRRGAMPAPAISMSPASRHAKPRRSSPRSPRRASRSRALGYYPNPLASRPGASQDGHRPPEEGDRRRRPHGRAGGQHLLRRRRGQDGRRQLGGGAEGLAGDHRPCARQRRQADLRELPDDLQLRRVAGRAQHRLFALYLAPHPRGLGRRCRHELRSLASRLADDRPGPLHPRVRRRTCCTSTPRT